MSTTIRSETVVEMDEDVIMIDAPTAPTGSASIEQERKQREPQLQQSPAVSTSNDSNTTTISTANQSPSTNSPPIMPATTTAIGVHFDPKRHWVSPTTNTNYSIPYAEQLNSLMQVETAQLIPPPPPNDTPDDSSSITPTKRRLSGKSKSVNELREVDWWLMLACTNQLESMQISRAGSIKPTHSSPPSVCLSDQLENVSTLVHGLGARVDAQDKDGFSVIHWLIFSAIWKKDIGSAVLKPDNELDLSRVMRYTTEIEPTLVLLLAASEALGYANPCKCPSDIGCENSDETPIPEPTKGNLLDLRDSGGNTPLHYAVHHERVDLVGLLLCHGANPELVNSIGQPLIDVFPWQPKEGQTNGSQSTGLDADEEMKSEESQPTTGASSSASGPAAKTKVRPHPLIAKLDTSIYESTGLKLERSWGTREGLAIEKCSYAGESNAAAIRRLLFQQILWKAVDEGDSGNVSRVKEVVKQWLDAAMNKTMFPLVYRADAFHQSPLQVAVAYETEDITILLELLKLPWLFHIQPRISDHSVMHKAVTCRNYKAIELLVEKGHIVNHRDSSTGQTPLVVVCALEEQTEDEVIEMAKQLISLGGDPLVSDEQGNDALIYAIYLNRLQLLKYLISTMTKEQVKQWITKKTNDFGNSPMHYGFYHLLPMRESHATMIEYLLSLGGSPDHPINSAGLSPLQVWTGWSRRSTHESRILKAIKKDKEGVEKIFTPLHRPKKFMTGQGKVIGVDQEVMYRSEFDANESEVPKNFRLIKKHQPTEDSKRFIEASALKKDREEKRLHEAVFRFTQVHVAHIPKDALEVRMTSSKGWGLFTKKELEKEQAIEMIGEVIPSHLEADLTKNDFKQNQCWILPKSRLYDHIHVYAINQKKYGNLSRFINHRCHDPNLSIYQIHSGRQAVAYANRDIKADEELTLDYEYILTPCATIVCHCGAKACRGRLV